jgi:metal-responsive CopG/Arc/MetJ family transcriptional regulator
VLKKYHLWHNLNLAFIAIVRIGGFILDNETVRLNITLPKGLVEAMNRMTQPRKRSGFIAEAVRQKIEQKEKEETEKLLVEGYQAAARESHSLTREFESADLEGWDDF